ncbi:MAG: flagellar basal body L-ring protein FlgH [Synergistaceae bacterium]|nr:flagellar basal body L-ring protein FlgH [Synergistaceae bacterium]MBQ3763694.1 flagellar basal body L-ring protein FlgH [Synergistaceae bacterium]MBQ6969639.1 flagellar basal body L-ring protein FlgH [Synergistaceae bacterium]MBQ7266803.1 flagellar basal body L-ring protein FlgH [Synergistaceae bacterium]
MSLSLNASLWDDNANWFADSRPGRVGDIITVVVSERTDASDESDMSLKKESTLSVTEGTGILGFIRGLTLGSSNESKGNGSIERTHSARTTLACLVTEVLPNGNLVIEGTRDVRTSDEILQLMLVGVIRPQDVNSDNQIQSSLIANAEISVKGRGVISKTQRPGLITQILQTMF